MVFEGGTEAGIDWLIANPVYHDLKAQAPDLAGRDILLVSAWDDRQVTIEGIMLPLYRALVAAGAARVRMISFQDDHGLGRSRVELAQAVAQWVLGGGA
ncbi:MAG: hypothetical protein Q8P31_12820 [Bacillota bacterium]|nr:hypothetical protein [Bacillota bacterium]